MCLRYMYPVLYRWGPGPDLSIPDAGAVRRTRAGLLYNGSFSVQFFTNTAIINGFLQF